MRMQREGASVSAALVGQEVAARWTRSSSAGSTPGTQMVAPQAQDQTLADPHSPAFWARGSGQLVVSATALAHAALGGLGAVVSAILWNAGGLTDTPLAVTTAAAFGVALASLLGYALCRSEGERAVFAARVLLPAVDLCAAAAMFAACGASGLALLLFALPPSLAAVLLSWRSGAVMSSLAVAVCAALYALVPGGPVQSWAPEVLVLAGVIALPVLAAGLFAERLAAGTAELLERLAQLRYEHYVHTAERQRLLEALNLLEEAQARLDQERTQTSRQVAELSAIAQRLGEGDLSAAQTLHPGLYGPFDHLVGALLRLSVQVNTAIGLRMQVHSQQRLLTTLSETVREQAQLLTLTDEALRDLGTSANRLVAEVQAVQRGSGELPGLERHALFQALRGVEQHTMAQASNTAMLSARLAQLRARQSALETDLQMLAQTGASEAASTTGTGLPMDVQTSRAGFEGSGVTAWSGMAPQRDQNR
jgi:hypothetical protein